MENYSIIAAGVKFEIGCRVVLWDEPGGLNLYKGKYGARNVDLNQLRKDVNSFIIHHSVTWRAKDTYNGLLGRGLSVNFIIDDDEKDGIATIYQCLDIKDAGYSHKPLNFNGPGVEICYQPTYWLTPDAYSDANQLKHKVPSHPIIEDKIHGQKFKAFGPTSAQVNACVALAYGISQAFPAIKMEFPKDSNGDIIKTTVPNPSGLLHHYNLTQQKIDALGFPSEEFEEKLKAWQNLGI